LEDAVDARNMGEALAEEGQYVVWRRIDELAA
jgi:hypothetical protein